MSFGATIELSTGYAFKLTLPGVADYTRETKKPFSATITSTLIYTIISIWMYVIVMSITIYICNLYSSDRRFAYTFFKFQLAMDTLNVRLYSSHGRGSGTFTL